jgi:DNA topoisomerase-1
MNLLIVESPSKAKTIEKYLGGGWKVIASVGHVRDLVPENGSVDTKNNFKMRWQIMPGKEKQIKLITDLVKQADAVYLASDPDREGEAIAWHILDILKSKHVLSGKPVYRVAFHEITKNAVMEAIKQPREIDSNLVDAYIVRRALDYLIGFSVSPLLWRRNLGRSAGRVQSVAVKLVVDREREIEAFCPQEYWSVQAECNAKNTKFNSILSKYKNEKIDKQTIKDKETVDKILADLGEPVITAKVINIDKKKTSRRAFAPFTTSTLQQEAARKLYFSSKRTMSVAQHLYEQGLITYMRTDATNLSVEAVKDIRVYISKTYGDKFLPSKPNVYVTKSKNAQEAHEAIRPTHFESPATGLNTDEQKLYDLIWKRTISCQMCNAEFDSVSVDIKPDTSDAIFHSVGTTCTFDGFMHVYNETRDDDTTDENVKLPVLEIGDAIDIVKFLPEQHFTQPPARFTEASLVKKLEELGIGRPSTYATIMSTIVDRSYVEQDKQHRFHPTSAGWIISAYLGKYFTDLVDVNFTAKTEDTLDDVSNGKNDKITALKEFWTPTEATIDAARGIKTSEIIDVINDFMAHHLFPDGNTKCPKCGGALGIKLSKYGAFIGCNNYPTCDYTLKIGGNGAADIPTEEEVKPNAPVDLDEGITFYPNGKFGPYVSNGKQNASAKGYTVETITVDIAKDLLNKKTSGAVGEELGENPATKQKILFYASGRYGPYISSNKVNVSVKEKPDLETAIELINNKKPAVYAKKPVKKGKK